jgi:hypothetical protein
VQIDGRPASSDGTTAVQIVYVSPEYFATIGQALVRGREFEGSDASGAPRVAIVNETAARRFWPDRDPLGRRIGFEGPAEEFTVVGVVADVKLETLLESGRPIVYLARQQHSSYLAGWTRGAGEAFVILRTNAEAAAVTQALTRAAADVGLPFQGVTPLEQRIGELLMPQRVGRMLLTLLGGMALMLTIVGIYGLVACLVARNTKEIGIRMTLGAGRQEILLVNSAIVPIACGVLAGSIVAWYGGRFADRFMYGMTGSDPATLALAAGAIAGAAVFAALLPAHRALRIDPVAALRAE